MEKHFFLLCVMISGLDCAPPFVAGVLGCVFGCLRSICGPPILAWVCGKCVCAWTRFRLRPAS